MQIHKILLLCLVPALFAGCTTLSKEECLTANWYAIGLEDGAQGTTLDRLGDHRRACAEYAIRPQPEQYMTGRNEGLKSFCTHDRGFTEGRAGYSYHGVCPEGLAANFLAGYQRGKEVYDLTHRLEHIQNQIEKTKTALKNGIVDPKARAREVEHLEDLSREAEQLEKKIRGLTGHH